MIAARSQHTRSGNFDSSGNKRSITVGAIIRARDEAAIDRRRDPALRMEVHTAGMDSMQLQTRPRANLIGT
jgi:hypothetical protein